MRALEILGKSFGRLTVLSRDEKDQFGLIHWKCLCDCGSVKVVSGRSLANGKTISCGCYRREFIRANQKPMGHSLLRRAFSGYKRGAAARGHSWELSFDRFKELSMGNCHYCGAEHSKRLHRDSQELWCNGIDRLKNDLGYVEGNVVSCCSPCNYLKLDRDYDEFVAQVLRISEHLEKRTKCQAQL